MKKFKILTIIAFIFCLGLIISGCNLGKNEYSITTETLAGGTITASETSAKEGEEITLSYTENDGYVFECYIVNGSFITDNKFIMPKENVVISAKFNTVSFTIAYHTDSYTKNPNTKLTYNIKTDTFALSSATKDGFVFDGWYTEGSLTNKITEIQKGTTGELNLYAKFNPIFTLNQTKETVTGLTQYGKNLSVVDIPAKIEGTTITTLGDNAFANANLNTLKFGKSINTFKTDVFKTCYSLKNVYFAGELSDWVKYNFFVNGDGKITSHPFYNAYNPNLYLNGTKVEGNLTFSKEITKVGANCFYKLDDILNVNYAGTLNEWLKIEFTTEHSSPLFPIDGRTTGPHLIIGGYAVGGEITIPNTINYIQPGALAYTNITKVTVPSSVKYVGNNAFYNCIYLEQFNLSSSSIAVINNYAFYGCKNLKLQSTPTSLITIGDYAFYNCSQALSSSSDISLNANLSSIGEYAFYGCTYLKGITLNSRIEEIKKSTFENSGIIQITFTISIDSIGHAAFRNCSHLTTIYVKKLSSTKVISGADDMFRDAPIQYIYFEDEEQMNLYKTKVYWNLYASKFAIVN